VQSEANECEELFSSTREGGLVHLLFICTDVQYTDEECRGKEVFPVSKREQVRCISNNNNNNNNFIKCK